MDFGLFLWRSFMLGVCFFVDMPKDVWWTDFKSRPTLRDWNDLTRALELDLAIYIDPYSPPNTHFPRLTHRFDLKAAMDSTPDIPWIFVEHAEPNSVSLLDFSHPTDAMYCFGGDSRGLKEVDRGLGTWLSIPTKYALWANQTAAIVLGNRQF